MVIDSHLKSLPARP